MSSEHDFDEKGKIHPKPAKKAPQPQKDSGRFTPPRGQRALDASTLARMQQTMGNAAVQRFMAQRSGNSPAELDEETATAIQSQRGSGNKIDESSADKAGQTMGHDLGDVNVHTDSQADQLSQQLGAKAFTTGNDIFFREGAYDPGSSDGQRLIAHELTHVVQQGATSPTVQGKMTVNDPDDQFEAEADSVADTVMTQEETAVQRQEIEEEEPPVQMQEMEEEEEAPVQMQEMEEEEEAPVQMQEMEEEEEAAAS
jgi:hypothetical protein